MIRSGRPSVLVVAKAPVAGRAKTRLGAVVGLDVAADLAAAALLDTLAACAAYAPGHCHLALAGDLTGDLTGDLASAVRGPELVAAVQGWTVHPQRGEGFDERLAHAHADAAAAGAGPLLQVGMDTPQLTPTLLEEAASGLHAHDAVLAPAEDGGWWLLGLRDPRLARCLAGVPMSTSTTYDDTHAALVASGLRVSGAGALRDVDTVEDAELVAAAAPATRFAQAWRELASPALPARAHPGQGGS